MSRRPPSDRERGAVIVVFTLTIVVLLSLSALVVDLGVSRTQRRENQSAADLSAIAAGAFLSGRGAPTAQVRPREACQAALEAAKTNLEQLPTSATIDCSTLPELGTIPACHGATPVQTIVASGTGPYTFSVTYPVPSSAIVNSSFAGGAGSNDGDPCERMKVTIGHGRSSFFAGVLGVDSLTTEATAVVRGATDGTSERVPAFLILSRTGCNVLTNSVGGGGNLGIIVGAPTPTEAGVIHTDSDASECGTNSSDYVIYGNALSGGGTSITVEDASGGAPGTISSYAASLSHPKTAAVFPGGISHPASPGPIISRQPVDNRYNPTLRPAISDLHTLARTRVLWPAATAAANGYTVLGCGDTNGTWADSKVFVACATWSPVDVRLPNATDLVTTGKIDIGNGRLLHLPVVQRLFVRGCPGCSGGGFSGVKVAGELYVNTGAEPIGGATCDNRRGPGGGGSTTNTAALVTFGSPVEISGTAYLCQTTVYAAAEAAAYTRATKTSGLPNCTTARPCPVTTGAPGSRYEITGYVEWSAPNQTSDAPSASNPFEDLALWTETSDTIEVKSGGTVISSGVTFAPNARVEFRSPATAVPRNAQMIVASFEMLQGTLKLAPVPDDGVGVESVGSFGLIR